MTKINLGPHEQFVKSLKPTSRAFRYIRQMFPSISEAKVKGSIIVRPQVRRMLASKELEGQMSDLERNAWQAFRIIVGRISRKTSKRRLCNVGVIFNKKL